MRHQGIHQLAEAVSPFLIRQVLMATLVMVAALAFAALLRRKTRAEARSNVLFGAMLLALSPLPLFSRPVNAALARVLELFRTVPRASGPAVADDAMQITALPQRAAESEIVCLLAVSWLAISRTVEARARNGAVAKRSYVRARG